ncbi:MAG: hypothetical protein ACD_79C00405G0001, partial [uncultured bacterium]
MPTKYQEFKNNLNNEIKSCNRDIADVKLIAASKYFNAAQIIDLIEQGQKDFGENRLQDALPKIEALKKHEINWHFFGHVQTNKAKKIAENFSVIHSLDSLKLAVALDKYCHELDKKIDVFLQVNLAKEEQKNGYEKLDLIKEIADMHALPNISILGLMLITPLDITQNEKQILFKNLKELMLELNTQNNMCMNKLSMGMSED